MRKYNGLTPKKTSIHTGEVTGSIPVARTERVFTKTIYISWRRILLILRD
ncbi:hypothetical protein CCP2SC5_180034 [Azospirillaceae bacterium]